MWSILVLLVSCIVLSVAQTEPDYDYYNYQKKETKPEDCGPNEEYSSCLQCPPEDSCYDRNQYACFAAFLPCDPGCICKPGFIRKTLDRECIRLTECGESCTVDEYYTDCKLSSNETCSSILNPSNPNDDSEEACKPGCACRDKHYRRNSTSPCLPRCLCPEMDDSPECASWNTPLG